MKNLISIFLFIIIAGCSKSEQNESNNIPAEVAHAKGYIDYLTPPNNFNAVLGWITAIHNKESTNSSFIEIDYMRLYATISGKDSLLVSDEYNDKQADGGLYTRVPWFENNDFTPMPNNFTDNEYLVLQTSSTPNSIWHAWNEEWPRATVPSNVERCWLEVRCKITGSAFIQIGIDYWKEPTSEYAGYNVNNIEAGVSDWYYGNAEWIILSFAKP